MDRAFTIQDAVLLALRDGWRLPLGEVSARVMDGGYEPAVKVVLGHLVREGVVSRPARGWYELVEQGRRSQVTDVKDCRCRCHTGPNQIATEYSCEHCSVETLKKRIAQLEEELSQATMGNHVFAAIARERIYQEAKYGSAEPGIPGFILVAKAELDEADHAWRKHTDEEALEELLQVAAVCVRAIEYHGLHERPEFGGKA